MHQLVRHGRAGTARVNGGRVAGKLHFLWD
jgi:hypothetical protein